MADHPDIPDGAPVGRATQANDGSARGRGRVASSFGSAPDTAPARIDLNDALIRHPQATFVMRAAGTTMRHAGIDDADVLLVDRAIAASHGHVVVAIVDGDMVCRRLWQQGGRVKLQAADDTTADIELGEGVELQVWGVVTTVVKSLLG